MFCAIRLSRRTRFFRSSEVRGRFLILLGRINPDTSAVPLKRLGGRADPLNALSSALCDQRDRLLDLLGTEDQSAVSGRTEFWDLALTQPSLRSLCPSPSLARATLETTVAF
jgi:hypothetical protein